MSIATALRTRALEVGVVGLTLAAPVIAWALLPGRGFGVVGPDVAMWADAAFRAESGLAVNVPPLYPMLCAWLSDARFIGAVGAGTTTSAVAAAGLGLSVFILARRVAGLLAAVVAALVGVGTFEIWGSGACFGPDALATLVVAGCFGAAIHLPEPGAAPGARIRGAVWLAVATGMLTLVREPGIFCAVGVSLAAVGRVGRWAVLPLGAALLAPLAFGLPASAAEAFPVLHKLEPVWRDAVALPPGSVPDFLLDVTASWPGPFPAIEQAIRASAAEGFAAGPVSTGARQRMYVVNALVVGADLLALAALGLAGTWLHARRRGRDFRAVHVAMLLPLLGVFVAWSQRRHALLWLGVDAIGIGLGVAALRAGWERVLGASVLASVLLASWLPAAGAQEWIRSRVEADREAVELGRTLRLYTDVTDLLDIRASDGRADVALRVSAQRPMMRPATPLVGPSRWRAIVVVDRRELGDWVGWTALPGTGDRVALRWGPERRLLPDCARGSLVGDPSWGLVPGERGQRAEPLPGPCTEVAPGVSPSP